MTSLYMYYAPSLLDSCFLSTLCHQQISVLMYIVYIIHCFIFDSFTSLLESIYNGYNFHNVCVRTTSL